MAKDKSKLPKGEKAKAMSAALSQEQAFNSFVQWLSRHPESDDVLKAAGVKRHQLFSLLADDEISQAVETRLDALLSVPYRLSPSEGPAAEFLLRQMSKFLRPILTTAFNARLVGYSVQEGVYEKDQEISDETGFRGLKYITEKPMEWFEPKINGELRYFPDNGSGSADGVVVDQTFKFFLTLNSPTYKQPQGKALLSKLYWPKYYRDNGWKFWGKNLERFGSPILVGKSSDTQAMLNALLMAHGSAVMSLDTEDEVAALGTANGNNGQAFDTFETAILRRINKVILGQTLTSGTDGGSGNRALGDVHNNVRKDKRDSDIQLVLPTLQRVVDALCAINGLPEHSITLADGKGLETERAGRDKTLSEIGVQFTEQYFQDEYNLSPEHFAVKNDQQQGKVFSVLPSQRFSFAAEQTTPGQKQIDGLVPDSYKLLDADQLKNIILDCDSPEQVAEKLFNILPDLPLTTFNQQLQEALYIADIIGYSASNEGK